jgi:hypothetical protein
MFIYKRNLTLYLAQTKLPKAVYDSVSFASEILDLPPSYKMREVKVIATPQDKEEPKDKKKIWTEVVLGECWGRRPRLVFSWQLVPQGQAYQYAG